MQVCTSKWQAKISAVKINRAGSHMIQRDYWELLPGKIGNLWHSYEPPASSYQPRQFCYCYHLILFSPLD